MTLRINLIRAMRKYTISSTDGTNQLTVVSKKEKYLLGQLCPVEIKGLSREDEALWKARIDRGFLTLMNTKCGY